MRVLPAVLLLVAIPGVLRSQAISPGKLSAAHAGLEGVRACTRCHELRTPGVAAAKCLACHAPLGARIRQGRGLHAQFAGKSCGECHKEHFGREFALVRLERAQFDHARTGYPLRGAHAAAECRACHRAERVSAADVRAAAGTSLDLARTFLGLPTACARCHAADDPHGEQFRGKACDACHDAADWRPAAKFDHDAAHYRLTGRHQDVECAACHRASSSPQAGAHGVRYAGLSFATCRSCHEDPHHGAMGGECTQCHSTAGWSRVAAAAVAGRFQHATTRFPLRGAHLRASCDRCHGRAPVTGIRVRFVAGTEAHTYPRPVAAACGSCHVDEHGGAFAARPGGGACETCHTEAGWQPAAFDAARHAATAFPLTGAHAAVPCAACHPASARGAARFRLTDRSCRGCHAAQDPHQGAFGSQSCDRCHETATFRVTAWDHARSEGIACRTCHADADPHGAQFAVRSCEECHAVSSFRIPAFDHGRTRFPLTGKHANAPCQACHTAVRSAADSVPRVRYRPLPLTCEGCHGGAP